MNALVEIGGWLGALMVLGAYALLAMKKLPADSYRYHGMNIIGSLLLAVYAIAKDASASLLINASWAVIGMAAVTSLYRRKAKG